MNPEISAAPTARTKSAEPPPPRISVLLVEDDRSVRRYLEVTLQRAGYEVITAEDGLAGMRCALTTKVDVVITDAVMPEMTGQQLARFLRNSPKLAKLPIILLTGQENHRASAADKKLIDAFLNKPVKTEELKKCLAKVLTSD
jgi:CheY-like chemotaxis protein